MRSIANSHLLVQTFTNLPNVGFQLIPILASWVDPCHLEFFQVNATTGQIQLPDFNSGAFNINSEPAATPTTWLANDLNSACPTFYTGGKLVASATATNNANSSTPSLCPGGQQASGSSLHGGSSGPSFGAGIGVGVAISAAVVAGTAAIWWLGHRQRQARRRPPELQANPAYPPQAQPMQYGNQPGYSQNPNNVYKSHVADPALMPPSEMVGDGVGELPAEHK
jgi:hypothetical protein